MRLEITYYLIEIQSLIYVLDILFCTGKEEFVQN